MRLLEQLGIKTAGDAASVTLHNYVSDRSVALLLRPTLNELRIGSGTCIRIANTYLIATVGHNFDGLALNQIELLPRGGNTEASLPIVAGQFRTSPDVGWLEVDSEAILRSNIKAVDICQLSPLVDEENNQVVVLVQGYPGERVKAVAESTHCPHVESDGLLSLVIPPRERSKVVPFVDFAIEYPPWDRSVDQLPLPVPLGISGGGVWQVPTFDNQVLWTPGQSRLLGLVESWQEKSRELFCVRIEQWLSVVQQDRSDLSVEIDAAIAGWTKKNLW
ncbi:MAG: hypothetical protein ABL902_08990 [Gallionella sp.]